MAVATLLEDWGAKQNHCASDSDCIEWQCCVGVVIRYAGHKPGYGYERTRMRCSPERSN